MALVCTPLRPFLLSSFITRVCAIKGTLRAAAGMFFVFFSCVSSCVLGEGIFVGRQSPVLVLL